ncbi:MAG: glycogen synthase GlgA [Gammaproteobacteria bacterium]
MKNILFVTSEAHPLVKTGGLADVSGSLPIAIKTQRRDIRIIMPAYKAAINKIERLNVVANFELPISPHPISILEGRLPGSSVTIWLVDSPIHFDRDGLYGDKNGVDWRDNAERFTVLARAVEAVALNQLGLDWVPEVVHCNDWQSGLVPALLSYAPNRPATVFTIHNLAYQGLFSWEHFEKLHLPGELWSMHNMEFYNQFSFIKGGLVYSDMINTVSPTYAKEICTPEHGAGLDVLLSSRSDRLVGILNGVDYSHWSPAKDSHLEQPYNVYTIRKKLANKHALQKQFGLPVDDNCVLLGHVGRLVEQKGVDLILKALPKLVSKSIQLVILGTGNKQIEETLLQATQSHPQQVAAHIGYSEDMAHQIEGGADIFLMPSRYEPCGLNQIYSLRYGTVPIVHRTGGLADTVTDATEDNVQNGIATGYVFDELTPESLITAIDRALVDIYDYPRIWKKILFNGMQQDFSWRRSAKQYLELYQQAYEFANE